MEKIFNKQIINETTEEKVLKFLQFLITGSEWNNRVFLAGGAVRDEIMGKPPKDLDFVIKGNINAGVDFAVWLAKSLGNYKEGSNPVIYPKYGTAKVSLNGNRFNLPGIELEFVAPRLEKYTEGSRNPEVSGGTLRDDVMRRDLTINSLLKNVSTGEIVDLTGKGVEDIKKGYIRTPQDPEIIFKDDPLRMLRAIRFTVRYGFNVDPSIIEGITKHSNWINVISKERIRDELDKILVSQKPDEGIRLLQSTGLLKHIIPELDKTVGMDQGRHHTEDVFNHILSVVSNTPPELNTRLMALFHDIGKVSTQTMDKDGSVHFYDHENVGAEMTNRIMTELKYPNDIIKAVVQGVGSHMRMKSGGPESTEITDKTLRKFSKTLGDNLNNVLDLIHADNVSHKEESSMPDQVTNIKGRLDKLNQEIEPDKNKLPINGNDVMSLGVPQGRSVGDVLDLVQDAWFENPNMSREEAIDIVNQFKIENNINEIRKLFKKVI